MLGPQLLPYLLAASFMSAPGGILMAKIIMPDDPAAREAELRAARERAAQEGARAAESES